MTSLALRPRSLRSPLSMCLLIAVPLFLFASCSQKEGEVVPEVAVQVAPAKTGDIAQIVTSEAVVFPLQQAILAPKITSTIKSFEVQRGAHVHKGQLLAVLENADLSAAAVQSKGEFEQAEAGYITSTAATLPEQLQKAELDAVSAKTALDAAQKMYDSRKELFQQGALPRRDLDAAEVGLSQARSLYEQSQKQLDDLRRVGKDQALKSASGQLSAAKGKMLGAEAMYSYSQIRSPIDGVVTDRPQYPGELATANQPLLTVMNSSHLIAKAHVSQSQAAALKTGNAATIQMAGVEDPIPAKLTLVSPALDPGSTTIEVWVETSKPPAALKPGMTVQVSIIAATAKDVILVPKSAVFQSPEAGSYLLVAGKDNVAHQKNVQLGLQSATETQITSGIAAGDSIIVSGGYGLPDKTKIKIETAPAADEAGKSGEKSLSAAPEKE